MPKWQLEVGTNVCLFDAGLGLGLALNGQPGLSAASLAVAYWIIYDMLKYLPENR